MKILILSILFISVSQLTSSQYAPLDSSLAKYSYNLMGIDFDENTAGMSFGTGFFLRRDTSKIFVTAKHIFHSCDYWGNILGKRISSWVIFRNYDKGLHMGQPLSIKVDFDSAKCFPIYSIPDCIGSPVKDTAQIFSLNDLISDSLPNKMGQIVVFGFPFSKTYDPQQGLYVRPATAILVNRYDFRTSSVIRDLNNNLVVDTINYAVHPLDVEINNLLKGFSGSPVFMKDDSVNRWTFLGLFSAVNAQSNQFFVVKAPILLRVLNLN